MGNPTGFLKVDRALPADRDPKQRLADWCEVHEHMEESAIRDQASRCMDCGIPFCQSGDSRFAPRVAGCPVNNLIPEWNDLVYQGRWQEAADRLHRTNNFPEFTGRVCPAPCEGACVLGIHAPAVTIKHHEYAIIERAFAEGWVKPQVPAQRTDKAIAIIGSGPAGLAAAAELNKFGHKVTVYERADRIGGLLMYGIPNMKLEKQFVERRVKLMAEEGVEFVTETEIGKHIPASAIAEKYDAVVLATGATKPRDLQVDGRQLENIHFAMEFLSSNTKSLLDSNLEDGKYISANNKNVVIIGGGDTGTDCVATALRHGCKHVVQLEIMPRPKEQRAADNPWPEWPKTLLVDYGQCEAIAVQGDDPRHYQTMTKKIVGDSEGKVKEIHTVQVEWVADNNGRMTPQELVGSEQVFKADLVLLAMGFVGPETEILQQLDVAQDGRTNAKAEYDKFATSRDGVFACGDARRGQSLIVWAIDEGRRCAKQVDNYLAG
ncbi:glutamate synthase (NADH) small subunit [Alteromonadaceae bacterium 2753L.S.0a.02]|nr:glutamate synthase (NADH) small subunit [Alteromonadaceae bacterium 2753L.S.0a.02]